MNHIPRGYLCTVLCAALLLPARAVSQNEHARSLSLEDAVRTAVRNNPELKSAAFDAEKANARVREAWGYTMPNISVSGQYARALKKQVFYLPGVFFGMSPDISVPVEIGSTHSVTLGVQATQILFNGAVFVGVGASQIYSDAAQEMYQGKRIEIVSRVRKAYYGALVAREARALMQQSLTNAEDNLRNVRLLRQQGVLSEYDELRASVGVENIRPMAIQAETNEQLALDALRNITGLPPGDTIAVSGALAFEPYDAAVLAASDETLEQTNPNLRALRLQKDVTEAFVSAERSNYLPTLVAFGNYQYQTQKNTFNISTNDFIASSMVGLNLSFNLFSGFQTSARVEQAETDVWKTEATLTNTENNLRTALRAARGTLEQARKRLDAQDKNVETAERGYKIVTTRFLAGSATQLEVNDAQLALTQAKVNRMQAIYDYLSGSADLDLLLGRIPPYAMATE